jgi:glutamate synthase (NADPH/NADH) large chain
VTAILAMMPPAWENDHTLSDDVRAMLEYFSLYEEKNDGPAAIIFNDGVRVGARLDRLGLRPLRSVETEDYLVVMSEAGQIDFPAEDVLRRGRIEAGGMLYFDHEKGQAFNSHQVMERLAKEKDYKVLLEQSAIHMGDLDSVALSELDNEYALNVDQCHTAYSLNQESFKFLLDPILANGLEKVSAMGYGLALNALSKAEGGVSRYFSQRFAQVTNPPLDSIRESDGMTLRVALGAKPTFSEFGSQQLIVETPVLHRTQLEQIRRQAAVSHSTIDLLFTPDKTCIEKNADELEASLKILCQQVEAEAKKNIGIIILSDRHITQDQAAIPALLAIAAANQHLVSQGLRFNSSIILETGQIASPHDVATALGFGASAICPLSVHSRVNTLYTGEQAQQTALDNFQKGVAKSLMKTMGKFGLCTVESYIGGEFFESNYLDTDEPRLKAYFPNIHSSVGGAQYVDIAASATEWHLKALVVNEEADIPFLGLFKERQDGSGHTFGNLAVREFIAMTDEDILYIPKNEGNEAEKASDTSYLDFGYEKRTPEQIDQFGVTPAYRSFVKGVYAERESRPAALRDVLAFPVDIREANSTEDFNRLLGTQNLRGNNNYLILGLKVDVAKAINFTLSLTENSSAQRVEALAHSIKERFSAEKFDLSFDAEKIIIQAKDVGGLLNNYLNTIQTARNPIQLSDIQSAHEITSALATGAMSHGALLSEAHEAVAQGTNIAGAMSNSGEGGEHSSRFGTIRSSKIKQFASGRFGVWAGYLDDSNIEEIEIKIAQGAKPGEGGQLPAAKVSVEIASLRGGTPKV